MQIEGRYYFLESGGWIRSFIVLKPSPTWYRKRLDILIIVAKIDIVLRGPIWDISATYNAIPLGSVIFLNIITLEVGFSYSPRDSWHCSQWSEGCPLYNLRDCHSKRIAVSLITFSINEHVYKVSLTLNYIISIGRLLQKPPYYPVICDAIPIVPSFRWQ